MPVPLGFASSPLGVLRTESLSGSSLTTLKPPRQSFNVTRHRPSTMLLPPPGIRDHLPPPTERQLQRPHQKFDPDYPGTLPPGGPDCYPLEEIMNNGVLERMEYIERDRDERPSHIFEIETDILEWLAEQGRLLPSGSVEEGWDTDTSKGQVGLANLDFDSAKDDDPLLGQMVASGRDADIGMDEGFENAAALDMGETDIA